MGRGGGGSQGSRGGGGRRGTSSRGSVSRTTPSIYSSHRSHSHHYHHHHHHDYHDYDYHGPEDRNTYLFKWTVAVIIIAVFIFANMFGSGGSSITMSTHNREKLDTDIVVDAYFEDNIGWISNETKLEKGLEYFEDKTGVIPYLYLTETINGDSYPSDKEMSTFAANLYDELFDDEAHLLLVFQEYNSNGNYFSYYVAGNQAKTVMDSEAGDILLDYIDSFYYQTDLSEEEMFAKAFTKTADRIMDKTTNPIVIVVVVISVPLVLGIAVFFWLRKKKIQQEEDERLQRILDTDIETLVDNEEI